MTTELTFHVPNMTCASCANRVRKALDTVAGLELLEINPAIRTVRVLKPDTATATQLIGALAVAGYEAKLN